MKWLAPSLAYLAVGLGLFVFRSAWSALLGFHAAIIVPLLIARPDIPVSSLIKSKDFTWVASSVLLCGSSGAALFFLWDYFGIAGDLPLQVESLGLNSRTWIPFIAYFALVNPFIEEYFWRGYLGSRAEDLHSSDIVYSGYHALILIGRVHYASIVIAVTVLALAGWCWRQIARKDGGLLAPVLGHMAADFTILVTIFNMTS